jgi:hypothetical protein
VCVCGTYCMYVCVPASTLHRDDHRWCGRHRKLITVNSDDHQHHKNKRKARGARGRREERGRR